jgi:hypothetical protein
MNDKEALHLWTVYDHPRDYPDSYVARLMLIGRRGVIQRTNAMYTADSLDELRSLLPPGLTCLPRHEEDDPVILEVWI